ncbi:MAG: winged helix DNA-binding protein [Stellaceae bacterium]
MNNLYLNLIQLLPEIHRRFMEAIKMDLEELKIHDINNVQSIILFSISDTEQSIGELTSRGVHMRSNVSYNVKKMVENDYLTQEHSPYDRRVSYVSLTEKGRKLREELTMAHQRRIDLISEITLSIDELQATISVLHHLDRLWADIADRWRRSRSLE